MGQKFKNQQTLFLFVELYYTVFFNDWTKIVLDPICDHIEIRSSDRLKYPKEFQKKVTLLNNFGYIKKVMSNQKVYLIGYSGSWSTITQWKDAVYV